MENKEESEEENLENLDVRLVKLSSTFSKNRYIFYSSLRIINSILTTSNTLWYTYYYLIRKDEDKIYSYFTAKPKESLFDAQKKNEWNAMETSKERNHLESFTTASLIFCISSNILLRLQKRSLTKLLTKIKSSHIIKRNKKKKLDPLSSSSNDDSKEDEELRELEKKKIYLTQIDLQLLDKWKVLLGGIKYWFGSIQLAIIYTLYVALLSETTMYDRMQLRAKQAAYNRMKDSSLSSTNTDGMQRYFQYTNDTQEIEWPEHVENGDIAKQIEAKPIPPRQLSRNLTQTYLVGSFIPSFIICYSELPAATVWFVAIYNI